MDSVLGGGVLLAVAAALWLVYLVPNWLRRSEYLATERNAVRLQQTIRVLAETAETPEAVRLESIAKAKALEAQLRKRPVAVGTAATLPLPAEIDPRARTLARLRRTRIATTAVIAIAALVLISQGVIALAVGVAAASGVAVALAAGFLVAGLWLQGRLARVARSRRSIAGVADAAAEQASRVERASAAAEPASREWTPTPLPKPLGQLRREAALRAIAEQAREARAREAQERTAIARAAAQAARPPIERAEPKGRPAPVAVLSKPASRFAAMGVIDPGALAAPDIDRALARRRAS